MTLNLYTISDEPNKINKTLGTAVSLTGTLRDPTEIENPIIQIEGVANIGSNYAYIPEFGRYYFTDKRMDSDKLMTLTLKVDVLMTYKSAIMSTPMIIERSEQNGNNYLNDSQRPIFNTPMTLTKKFPSGFDSFHFYLTTAG